MDSQEEAELDFVLSDPAATRRGAPGTYAESRRVLIALVVRSVAKKRQQQAPTLERLGHVLLGYKCHVCTTEWSRWQCACCSTRPRFYCSAACHREDGHGPVPAPASARPGFGLKRARGGGDRDEDDDEKDDNAMVVVRTTAYAPATAPSPALTAVAQRVAALDPALTLEELLPEMQREVIAQLAHMARHDPVAHVALRFLGMASAHWAAQVRKEEKAPLVPAPLPPLQLARRSWGALDDEVNANVFLLAMIEIGVVNPDAPLEHLKTVVDLVPGSDGRSMIVIDTAKGQAFTRRLSYTLGLRGFSWDTTQMATQYLNERVTVLEQTPHEPRMGPPVKLYTSTRRLLFPSEDDYLLGVFASPAKPPKGISFARILKMKDEPFNMWSLAIAHARMPYDAFYAPNFMLQLPDALRRIAFFVAVVFDMEHVIASRALVASLEMDGRLAFPSSKPPAAFDELSDFFSLPWVDIIARLRRCVTVAEDDNETIAMPAVGALEIQWHSATGVLSGAVRWPSFFLQILGRSRSVDTLSAVRALPLPWSAVTDFITALAKNTYLQHTDRVAVIDAHMAHHFVQHPWLAQDFISNTIRTIESIQSNDALEFCVTWLQRYQDLNRQTAIMGGHIQRILLMSSAHYRQQLLERLPGFKTFFLPSMSAIIPYVGGDINDSIRQFKRYFSVLGPLRHQEASQRAIVFNRIHTFCSPRLVDILFDLGGYDWLMHANLSLANNTQLDPWLATWPHRKASAHFLDRLIRSQEQGGDVLPLLVPSAHGEVQNFYVRARVPVQFRNRLQLGAFITSTHVFVVTLGGTAGQQQEEEAILKDNATETEIQYHLQLARATANPVVQQSVPAVLGFDIVSTTLLMERLSFSVLSDLHLLTERAHVTTMMTTLGAVIEYMRETLRVAHNDLHPRNVLFDGGRARFVLADFGSTSGKVLGGNPFRPSPLPRVRDQLLDYARNFLKLIQAWKETSGLPSLSPVLLNLTLGDLS